MNATSPKWSDIWYRAQWDRIDTQLFDQNQSELMWTTCRFVCMTLHDRIHLGYIASPLCIVNVNNLMTEKNFAQLQAARGRFWPEFLFAAVCLGLKWADLDKVFNEKQTKQLQLPWVSASQGFKVRNPETWKFREKFSMFCCVGHVWYSCSGFHDCSQMLSKDFVSGIS